MLQKQNSHLFRKQNTVSSPNFESRPGLNHPSFRVAGKFKLERRLGSGAFGVVYLGKDLHTGEEVAIKTEPNNVTCALLLYEAKIVRLLDGGKGLPKLIWCGVESEYNIMVCNLLGPSLEDMLIFCNRSLSVPTVLRIADQLIERSEYLHEKHFIHRDYKPCNFLLGLGSNKHQIYLIDFGLSKRYIDYRTKKHISYRQDKQSITGTARYCSINTHLGVEQSRRDDMEVLGYCFCYLLRGHLPWQGISAPTPEEKYNEVAKIKTETPPAVLCKGFPEEFVTYFEHVKSMKFDDTPDYEMLRQNFQSALRKEYAGLALNSEIDWQSERQRSKEVEQSKIQEANAKKAFAGSSPVLKKMPSLLTQGEDTSQRKSFRTDQAFFRRPVAFRPRRGSTQKKVTGY